jgi:DoxX
MSSSAIKWSYHLSRLIFGGWWLYSGVMPFIDPTWQPKGQEQAAIDFTNAMLASGLMVWVKVAEIVCGALILANRQMPLVALAIVPINFVILYWNFVLEVGTVEYVFGALTIVFNAILIWPWRRYYWRLFTWKGQPDFSTDPGIQS